MAIARKMTVALACGVGLAVSFSDVSGAWARHKACKGPTPLGQYDSCPERIGGKMQPVEPYVALAKTDKGSEMVACTGEGEQRSCLADDAAGSMVCKEAIEFFIPAAIKSLLDEDGRIAQMQKIGAVFAEKVRGDAGEDFANWENSRDRDITCSAAGKRGESCWVHAYPCKAPAGE